MTQYNPPVWLHDLEQPRFFLANQLPLMGQMRRYVGQQISWEQIYDLDQHSENDIPKLKKWVRAYSVPLLVGKVIHIHHQNELSTKLHELLQNTLSDIDWEPFEVSTAPFRKYFIVHFDIPAPPEWLTQQPMGLEFFGALMKVNGDFLNSERGQCWREEHDLLRFQTDREEREWSELVGDFEIKIDTATYSNVRYPGVDVPLYL